MKKAQIFTLDFIFAIIIFITVIIILISAWDSSLEKIVVREQRNNLEILVRNAANILIQTEGSPSNWTTNVSLLGLTFSLSQNQFNSVYKSRSMALNQRGGWNIDPQKITNLQTLDYTVSKNLLGLLRLDEHYYLSIFEWNNTDYNIEYTMGLVPYNNVSSIVNLERFIILNNNWAKFNLKIWQECEGSTCI